MQEFPFLAIDISRLKLLVIVQCDTFPKNDEKPNT